MDDSTRNLARIVAPVAFNSMPTFHCPACSTDVDKFVPGPNGRPNARCPACDALERHRFIALLLESWRADFEDARVVLEIAPQRQVQRLVRGMIGGAYVGLDLDPGANPDILGDITSLPLADGSVDVILCMHVLEHIPDDGQAISELARVLASTGLAFIQVPRRLGISTDEDPSASQSERIARFGQADHVRYYGDDFEQRLFTGGIQPTAIWPGMFLRSDQIEAYGLKADEWMWIGSARRNGGDTLPTRVDIDRQLAEAQADVARLRNHPVVSTLRRIKRLVRRA